MHLFQFPTLLYLFFHAVAFFLMMGGILGLPGHPDETTPLIRRLLKIWGICIWIAWKGLPSLGVAALIAFYFHYDAMGKIISCTSLGIGILMFVNPLLYYTFQSKK